MTQSSPKLQPPSRRKDAPALNFTARGDKRKGMQIAGDPALLDKAIGTFQSEIRSAGDTTDAYVKTWTDFHNQVRWARLGIAEPCPVVPLTPRKIEVIGAILKGSHYRSTKNYISSIKRYHRLCGFDWHDQLDLAYSSFVASTQRGIGPGKQSSPLPFSKFGEADLNSVMSNDEYPVKPGWCSVLFTFFLLRELECATAEFADLTLDTDKLTVKMFLSVSKNDPRAMGCDRTWVCVFGRGQPQP